MPARMLISLRRLAGPQAWAPVSARGPHRYVAQNAPAAALQQVPTLACRRQERATRVQQFLHSAQRNETFKEKAPLIVPGTPLAQPRQVIVGPFSPGTREARERARAAARQADAGVIEDTKGMQVGPVRSGGLALVRPLVRGEILRMADPPTDAGARNVGTRQRGGAVQDD
jgi:hypothetical protein